MFDLWINIWSAATLRKPSAVSRSSINIHEEETERHQTRYIQNTSVAAARRRHFIRTTAEWAELQVGISSRQLKTEIHIADSHLTIITFLLLIVASNSSVFCASFLLNNVIQSERADPNLRGKNVALSRTEDCWLPGSVRTETTSKLLEQNKHPSQKPQLFKYDRFKKLQQQFVCVVKLLRFSS